MFVTGDRAEDHGLLVFDLEHLRNATTRPVVLEPSAKYEGIASAHNLVIDTESGFAFTVGNRLGGETCGGGLHMVDIRDPSNPVFAGCYTDTEGLIWQGRTHDGQCVVYRGPDEDYRGRQICFALNETAVRIVDVTDKANPMPISAGRYPGTGYIHQGWVAYRRSSLFLPERRARRAGRAHRRYAHPDLGRRGPGRSGPGVRGAGTESGDRPQPLRGGRSDVPGELPRRVLRLRHHGAGAPGAGRVLRHDALRR